MRFDVLSVELFQCLFCMCQRCRERSSVLGSGRAGEVDCPAGWTAASTRRTAGGSVSSELVVGRGVGTEQAARVAAARRSGSPVGRHLVEAGAVHRPVALRGGLRQRTQLRQGRTTARRQSTVRTARLAGGADDRWRTRQQANGTRA